MSRLSRPTAPLWLGSAAAALLLALCAGHDWATPADYWRAAWGDDSLRSLLLLRWRAPRVLAAGLIGALLGLSGAIFQGLFRNPLAEPYLLGASSGAAVGATLALLTPLSAYGAWSLSPLAFLGAWGAAALALSIARLSGAADAAGLLLAGVAVAATLSALRSFLMLALSDETVSLQAVVSWSLGGVATPRWGGLALLAAAVGAALALGARLARGLDLLGLGSDLAAAFGLDERRFMRWAAMLGAGVAAIAVSQGGVVPFIGLIGPHIARWRVGPSHRRLLPVSAAVGAVLTVLADALARSILPPAEIPLGVVTAGFGGPVFLLLLARRLRA